MPDKLDGISFRLGALEASAQERLRQFGELRETVASGIRDLRATMEMQNGTFDQLRLQQQKEHSENRGDIRQLAEAILALKTTLEELKQEQKPKNNTTSLVASITALLTAAAAFFHKG